MKTQRQAKILELVSQQDVQTQEQLLDMLQKAGYICTQATISRDIKELRIVKELSREGIYRYSITAQNSGSSISTRLNAIFLECITGVDHAQNMVVIHTIPGLAGAAASAVDAMKMQSVLGSIGGDDTVLIVLRDSSSAAELSAQLQNLLK